MGNVYGSIVLVNEKINMLKYLEILCINIDVVNVLINGLLMLLLVKLLCIVKILVLCV